MYISVTETAAPSNTIALGTGTNPAGNTAVCPATSGVYVDDFAFTVAGANDTVTAVTASGLGATTGVASIEIRNSTGTSFAPAKTCTPAGDTCAFTATGLSAPIGTTNYRFYVNTKAHGVGNLSFTPIINGATAFTATNTKSGTDTANLFTIDDTAQANVGASSTNTPTSSSLTLALGASAGLTEYVVWARKGAAPGVTPVDGTQYAVQPYSATAAYVAYVGTATNPTISGLEPSSAYQFAIFARDACFNYSTTAATATGTTAAPAQAVTVGNGTPSPSAAVIVPGATTWTPVDAFDLVITSGPTTGNVTGITWTAITGTSQYLAGVRFVRVSDGVVLGTDTAATGEAWSISAISEPITTTTQQYRVEVQPKAHSAMPAVPGAEYTIAPGGLSTDAVTNITTSTGASVSYSDGIQPDPAFGAIVIDNKSPADVTGAGALGGGLQATVSWTNPGDADFQKVVVLKKAGTAFGTEKPAEGDDPAVGTTGGTYGTATVAYVGAASPALLTGLTAGTWYFKVFSRDVNGNFAAGVATPAAVVENFQADGDLTPYSNKPVISILNPKSGAVLTLPTKVQVRVYSPTAGGALVPADTVNLVVNGTNHALATGARNTRYQPSSATAGIWEYTIPVGEVAAGTAFELRANATNTAGGPVYSARVNVKIAPVGSKGGDGNLLVRDNSSQLCSDCHAGVKTHSSEGAGNKHGSWAATCLDCHTPHSTTNLGLVRTQIKPLEVNGTTTAVAVAFRNKTTGYGTASYASAEKNGPCQVCHTRTDYYLSTGLDADGSTSGNATTGHNPTAKCVTCHLHTKGLGASCTQCHGDKSGTYAAVTGADARVAAAPPTAADGVTTTGVRVGVHQKHVNSATYRGAPLACANCHPVPNKHNGTRDAAWSAIASANPNANYTISPAAATGYDATFESNPTCTNWCHGDGLQGGGRGLVWSWNTPQTTGCNSCHGQAAVAMPNLANAHHPQNSACANCHGAGYATTGIVAPAATTHVDGTVQRGTGCRACHGLIQPAGTTPVALNTDPAAAPGYDASSVDSKGNTARTAVGVGAHIRHVNAGLFMSAKCAQCHVIPADGNIAHANGALAWSWVATGGVTPTYTAGSCVNYCHSNAAPLGGTLQTPATAVSWNGTTPQMSCTTCHQTATFGGTGLSVRHSKHLTGAGGYAFTCDECHTATMQDDSSAVIGTVGNHVNGTKNVTFSATAMAAALNQAAGNYTSYTCSATYCHSGGVATAAPFSATASAAIAWNSAASTTCRTCHGFTAAAAPTMGVATGSLFAGSAAHMNHVANNAAAGGVLGTNNYLCGDCHKDTVAATTDSPITTVANHVNGVKNVSIAPRGTIATTQTYAGTCNTTYCHSTGQHAYAFAPVAWNATAWTNKCTGCHGTGVGNTTGAPDYGGTGTADTATANSHAAHVGSSADCATCHNGFVTAAGTAINGTSHTNGVINVAFDVAKAGTPTFTPGSFTAPSTYVSATCSNVKCHGAATGLKWGGPAQTCNSCHGTTAAETKDLGASFWNNGITATINTNEWSYSGHGKASGSYDITLNPAAAFPTTPTAGLSECLYCHDKGIGHGSPSNPFRLRGVTNVDGVSAPYDVSTTTLANSVCLNCHSATAYGVDPAGTAGATGNKTATLKDPGVHQGAKHTVGTLGGKFCWDCHDPHGDRPNATTNNIAMLANSVTRVSDGTYGYVGATGTQVTVTYKTEAATPPSATLTEGKAVETATAAGTQHIGLCQACHGDTSETYWTKYWNRLGYEDPNGPPNTDRTLSSLSTSHNYGSTTVPYCISCHSHKSGFGGECVGCHAVAQTITKGPLGLPLTTNTRPNVVGEFRNAWSHKRSTSPLAPASIVVTNQDCVPCHMEAEPATATPSGLHGDGYVDLRNPDTGNQITGATWGGTDAGTYTADAVAVRFGRFSRNLGSNTLEPEVRAIMINQCLKCHDANGAASIATGQPLEPLITSGFSAVKPFGQTTLPLANYTGTGITAGGVAGGVTDIYESFKTTNASYHPILGKQNNSYANSNDMVAPWNMAKTTGNLTSWGYLMTCWDCHAPYGTASTATLTRTVTAHGGATTIRGSTFITSGSTTQFCRVCHLLPANTNSGHGTGSAAASIDNNPWQFMAQQCHLCHGSQTSTKPARPIAGQDAHGFDSFAPAMGTDKLWPLGATESYKPYAFMRNVGPSGQWRSGSNSWRPRSGPGVPAATSGTCQGTLCRSNHGTYTPAGVY